MKATSNLFNDKIVTLICVSIESNILIVNILWLIPPYLLKGNCTHNMVLGHHSPVSESRASSMKSAKERLENLKLSRRPSTDLSAMKKDIDEKEIEVMSNVKLRNWERECEGL